MNYQELIEIYPWLDVFLELFKGIMPTMVALIAIFVNEHFTKKRSLKYKQRDIQLKYLEDILNWMQNIKNDILKNSLLLENSLRKENPEIRREKFNEFIQNENVMIDSVIVWNDTYSRITDALGYDLQLSDFKEVVSNYHESIIELGGEYIHRPNTDACTEEINDIVMKAISKIDTYILLLVAKINLLCEKC